MAHLDDRLDDQARLVILADRGDEIALDLDLLDRELAQVGERGEAGAEIVEADGEAAAIEHRQRGVELARGSEGRRREMLDAEAALMLLAGG